MAWTDYYLDLGAADGGDGSVGDPWQTLAEALSEIVGAAYWNGAAATFPTRIYVKGNGSLAANLNWNAAGTNAYPITFVGCDAAWAVIGNDASATKPTVTCDAYTFDVTGAYITFENLAFTSSHVTAGGTMDVAAVYITFKRCRITATGENANSCAFRTTAGATTLIGCYFTASTTASFCVNLSDSGGAMMAGNVLVGGVTGINVGTGPMIIVYNIIRAMGTGSGIICSANAVRGILANNTIIGHATIGDGIVFSGTTPAVLIMNNLIHTFTNPINISNATSSSCCPIAFNAWHNCTNDTIAGVIEKNAAGDGGTHGGAAYDFCNCIWNYGDLADDPLPNAATLGDAADFTLAYAARALAFPGIFEAGAYAYQGYLDHGAVQRAETYPTAAQVQDTVTFGGLGATAGSNALTGTLAAGGGGGTHSIFSSFIK